MPRSCAPGRAARRRTLHRGLSPAHRSHRGERLRPPRPPRPAGLRRLAAGLLLAACLAACAGYSVVAAAAPLFRITLVSGAPGQSGCELQALNDLGQVVGRCGSEGFLWDPAGDALAIRDPAHPHGNLYPAALNNLGVVVGARWTSEGASPGFVWSAAAGFDYFGTHRRIWDPRAINDAGVVAGHSASRDTRAYVWKAFRRTPQGVLEPLKPSAYRQSMAQDINASGQIAGFIQWRPGHLRHAVRFEPDGSQLRLVPGRYGSGAAALNDAGEVAGALWGDGLSSRAFLWRPETGAVVIDPRTGAQEASGAGDLNAARQVVGGMSWVGPDGLYEDTAFYWDEATPMTDLRALIDPDDPLLPRVHRLSPIIVRINAAGQVALNAYDAEWQPLMLLLRPVVPR